MQGWSETATAGTTRITAERRSHRKLSLTRKLRDQRRQSEVLADANDQKEAHRSMSESTWHDVKTQATTSSGCKGGMRSVRARPGGAE